MDRYHRQMLLPDFGPEGQSRLVASHAMIIGCGALGCPAADLLVRAGVGTVSLIDRDVVELTNLQRQTLFDERDARDGTPKAEAAARRLGAVNSSVRVQAIVEDFSPESAEGIVRPHPKPNVLLDCTDNFETRYLINDVAVQEGVAYVYGGAVGTTGMGLAVLPGETACLRCVFPEAPPPGMMPTCDTAGILASVSMMVAAWQATEAIKILLGRRDRLAGSMLQFDAWHNEWRRIDLGGVGRAKRADCPCCGERRFEFLRGQAESGTTVLCGRNSVQVTPSKSRGGGRVDLEGLVHRLEAHGSFAVAGEVMKGKLNGTEGLELTVFRDGRAIVGGTTDVVAARAAYSRYVGS